MKFTPEMDVRSLPREYRGPFAKWKKYHQKPLSEVFWKKVNIKTKSECWPYKGGHSAGKHQYGLFYIRNCGKFKQSVAHRMAWRFTFGEIPNGLRVCHKCDNPPCCNPDHLFLGTDKDNSMDCKNKHRNFIPKGELSGSHKLTERQVLEIRQKYSTTRISHAQLALEYGVTKPAISAAVCGRHWKHLGNGVPGRIDTRRRKLSEDSVKMARIIYAQGKTQQQIADKLGVSPTTISAIVRRKTWNHVKE